MYDNEAEVGQGMVNARVPREEIFLVTKVRPESLDSKSVQDSTEQSLRKLKTPYVDLLLIHWPSRKIPLEETLAAMFALKKSGKVRAIGVSNFPTQLVAKAMQQGMILTNQVEYHPYLAQQALLKQFRAGGPFLTAYSPLARGKACRDKTVSRIAAQHNKTPAQVVLRWLVQQEGVVAIPKAATMDHRVANFEIFDFELSDSQMQAIHGLACGRRLVNPRGGPRWDRE